MRQDVAGIELEAMNTPFQMEEIIDPPVLSIDEVTQAGISDVELVIGVSVGGEHMALRVSAMRGAGEHEARFSDLGRQNVTVIYCDIMDYVRAFRSDAPMDLKVQGFGPSPENGKPVMLLDLAGDSYAFDSKRLPLRQFDIVEGSPLVTTWGRWKSQHPETRFYNGFDFESQQPK